MLATYMQYALSNAAKVNFLKLARIIDQEVKVMQRKCLVPRPIYIHMGAGSKLAWVPDQTSQDSDGTNAGCVARIPHIIVDCG